MSERSFQPLEEPADAPDSLDFKQIFSTLRERVWWIVVCLIVSGVASVIYLNRAPRIYAATAVLKVDPNPPKLLDLPGIIEEDYRGAMLEPRLREIRQTLLSRPVLLRVVETNALGRDLRFVAAAAIGAADNVALARQLERMLQVSIPKDNNLVMITVENASPELAAQLANSLVSELILQNSRSQGELMKTIELKLSETLHTLRQEVKQYETNLQPYWDKALLLGQRQTDIARSLSDLNQKLSEAMLQRVTLETQLEHAEKLGTNAEALLKLPPIAADPSVANLRAGIAQKEANFFNLKQRYKEKHPTYIKAQNELAALQAALAENAVAAVQTIRVSIESVKAAERTLQVKLEEQTAASHALSQELHQNTNNVLVREIELQRSIHDKVMQRLKEASIRPDLFYNPVRVFQLAEVPLKPAKPEDVKVLLIGLAGGLAVGVALALALGFVDTSLKSLEETEQFLELPVLTTVPRVRSLDSADSQNVMRNEGPFSGAESFRSLRTSISVLGRDKELRSVLFTSALPEEGKTFCAVNYAVSLAQQGLKTVLIECDLRRPRAHESFPEVKADAPGLTDYLRAQPVEPDTHPVQRAGRVEGGLSFAELRTKQRGEPPPPDTVASVPRAPAPEAGGPYEPNQLVQKSGVENLFLITAGTDRSSSSELLARQGINYLLADVLRRYDRVVMDSAPIFGLSDTLLLANRVHGVGLVIRANRTPRRAVMRAVEMLRRVDARLVGAVLNGLTSSRMGGYKDPYYDYGYISRKTGQNA